MRRTARRLIGATIFALLATTAWASDFHEDVKDTPKTSYVSMLRDGVENMARLVTGCVKFSVEHPKLAGVTALLFAGQIASTEALLQCHCYCRTYLVTCFLDIYLGIVPALSNLSGQVNCMASCAQHHGMDMGCYPYKISETSWPSYGLTNNCSHPM